jgi:hypothetical protein
VFDSNGDKAPGPDDLPFSFNQNYWDLVKEDVFSIVQAFYNQTLNLTKFNHASIILILKSIESNTIEQYRPISLINCSVKIIIKILTNRLARIH